jgi:hypothetical protein
LRENDDDRGQEDPFIILRENDDGRDGEELIMWRTVMMGLNRSMQSDTCGRGTL